MSGDEMLRGEINKRLTLNWLIQGAAQHAGMTFHYLIRDELDDIDTRLLRLYDQYALVNLLQYWHVEAAVLFGRPAAFWRRAASRPRHPFYKHPLLSRFGGALAAAGRQRAIERSKEKGLTRLPIVFSFQTVAIAGSLRRIEAPHRAALTALAKQAASTIWGIPTARFDAALSPRVLPDARIVARSVRGRIWRAAIVGYGGVERRARSLTVVGRGTNLQLLTKELVKGTAELICLHGLNELDDETYRRVISEADWLEFEPWMLQTGGELWRRLLMLLPEGEPTAGILMRLARLPAMTLEPLIAHVIERPELARQDWLALSHSSTSSD